MNSRAKGCRGERAWRDQLREAGYRARRGQQYCGGSDSPDVVCEDLPNLHQEVKCVERFNLDAAIEQAERDAQGKPWIIAHKKNRTGWRVIMSAELFFELLRNGAESLTGR